jgi:hypothetical protein
MTKIGHVFDKEALDIYVSRPGRNGVAEWRFIGYTVPPRGSFVYALCPHGMLAIDLDGYQWLGRFYHPNPEDNATKAWFPTGAIAKSRRPPGALEDTLDEWTTVPSIEASRNFRMREEWSA